MAKTYALQITRSLGVVVMRYLNILFGALFFLDFFLLVAAWFLEGDGFEGWTDFFPGCVVLEGGWI